MYSPGVRSQESGVRSQESGVRSQESGVRTSPSPSQESGRRPPLSAHAALCAVHFFDRIEADEPPSTDGKAVPELLTPDSWLLTPDQLLNITREFFGPLIVFAFYQLSLSSLKEGIAPRLCTKLRLDLQQKAKKTLIGLFAT